MSIERHIPIDDTYIHVVEFGRGSRPFVMLAGASLCGIEGLGDAIEAAYGCMCDDFHIYCMDTRRVMPQAWTVADMAVDAQRCLSQLGVTSACFTGASHGGMIAMTLAVEHPEMVRSLAICGSSPYVAKESASTIERWMALAQAHDVAGLGRAFFNDLYSKAFCDAHAELRAAFESHGTAADCERFITVLKSVLDFDIRPRLHEIKCRTLVLCSDDDRVLGKEASHEIANGIGCPLHEYTGLGHAFYDETADTPQRIKAHFLAD